MTGLLYLAALVVSLGGLAVIDRRFSLAFWHDARRAGWTVGIAVVGFLLWDLAGLALGIFARGDSPHMTGVLLAPELPLEEAFFLALLSYVGLLAWRWFDVSAAQRDAGRRAPAAADGPDGAGSDAAGPGAAGPGASGPGGGAR